MSSLDLTKDKADVYNIKRDLDGITGNLELLTATPTGYQVVSNGTFTTGWHPKRTTKFGQEEIFEMRIADVNGTRATPIRAATHLRYTQRGVLKLYKFKNGDPPYKATAVYKLELLSLGKA
jgi:hypothetical protein